jgi:hypothetical protein
LRRSRYITGEQKTLDEYQYNEPFHQIVTTFATLYASALQGDTLSLYVYPLEGFNSLTAYPSPSYEWIKTNMLYKKLGVEMTHIILTGHENTVYHSVYALPAYCSGVPGRSPGRGRGEYREPPGHFPSSQAMWASIPPRLRPSWK